MNVQVTKDHYSFHRYCYPERWASYYQQLSLVLGVRPESVLEIGVGDGVVRDYIIRHTSISYRTLDIARDLNPDLVGSVTDIPLPDKSVDTVCAFEVLEHIPFERFDQALAELSRVARANAIISLPHFGPPVRVLFKVPLLPTMRFFAKVPYPRRHRYNGEHYWEIGTRGFSPRAVRRHLRRYFSVEREYVPFDAPYHRFYLLKKAT